MAEQQIRFTITADTAGARKGVDEFGKSLDRSGQKAETASRRFDRFSKNLDQKVRKAAKFAAIGAVIALGAVGVASLKLAVDAEESENLFEVSMGAMAKAARDWSNEISRSLGLNSFEVRKMVGTFNVMLASMGLSKDAAFGMSTAMTKLTFDMASFFNLRPEVAFQKLQAGITGEAEPLKRLGILINENTIKQVAYTEGIVEYGAELSETQKIQARFLAIMKQTATAQGDLARTMDSPTNMIRILKSRAEELAIVFGQALIPSLKGFLLIGNDLLTWLQASATNMAAVAKAAIIPIQAFQAFRIAVISVVSAFKLLQIASLKIERVQLQMSNVFGVNNRAIANLSETIKKTQQERENLGQDIFDIGQQMLSLQEAAEGVGKAVANVPILPPVMSGQEGGERDLKAIKAREKAVESLRDIQMSAAAEILKVTGQTEASIRLEGTRTLEQIQELISARVVTHKDAMATIEAVEALTTEKLKAFWSDLQLEQAQKAEEVNAQFVATLTTLEGIVKQKQMSLLTGVTRIEAQAAEEIIRVRRAVDKEIASIDESGILREEELSNVRVVLKKKEAAAIIAIEAGKNAQIAAEDQRATDQLATQIEGFINRTFQQAKSVSDIFRQFLTQLVASFVKSAAKMVANYFQNINSISGGGGGGVLSSILRGIGSVFGLGAGGTTVAAAATIAPIAPIASLPLTGLQHGGHAAAGSPFLVGESGPELFVPRTAGTVMSNRTIGGNTFVIDARGAAPGAENKMIFAMKQLLRQSQTGAVRQMRDSILRSG